MKPQQLADLLGISSATLRRWAGTEYAEFLSPSARGANGAHRSFSEVDARIIAWIAVMRAQNVPQNDILMTLKSAQAEGWKQIPPLPGGVANDEPIAVVPREAVEERVRALQDRYELQLQGVVKERDAVQAQLEKTQSELEALKHESTETVKGLQKELTETTKTLQQRIAELSAREAEMRGLLAQYTIAGRRWNAMAIIAITLLVGVILTVIVLAAGILLSGR